MSNARYASTMKKNVIGIDFNRVGLGTRTDAAIAKDLGVPRRRVTKERAKRGLPAFTKANPGVTYATVSKSPKPVKRSAPKPVTQVVAATPVSAAPTPAPPVIQTPVQNQLAIKNYIAVVLDRSSSIAHYRLSEQLRNAYNGIVDTVKKNAKDSGQETVFSLLTFGTDVKFEIVDCPAEKLTHLTNDQYHVYGDTALFDGVGKAIEHLKSRRDANDINVSHLVIVITDGEENRSMDFRPDDTWRGGPSTKLLNLMREVQYTGRWTLAFNLPPGFKDKFQKNFQIPADNIREWEATVKGVRETAQQTSGGINTYYAARAGGQSASKSFFTTDMSKVSIKEIKNKLDDISDRFKSYTLEKEMAVKEFVELKTRKPYVIGSAYYMLFKTEEIQPQKQVLIMEKGKKAVWGGDEARKLIGLPQGVTAKVKPGNHANYDIFCQSTSVNRILPRGTVVLVDTTKLVHDKETWDSSKVSK